MTRRSDRRWGHRPGPRGRRRPLGRRDLMGRQAPPGGLLLLAVAGFVVHHTAQPVPAEPSLSETGDRVVGWGVDYALDVLEVIAQSGGMPA